MSDTILMYVCFPLPSTVRDLDIAGVEALGGSFMVLIYYKVLLEV